MVRVIVLYKLSTGEEDKVFWVSILSVDFVVTFVEFANGVLEY